MMSNNSNGQHPHSKHSFKDVSQDFFNGQCLDDATAERFLALAENSVQQEHHGNSQPESEKESHEYENHENENHKAHRQKSRPPRFYWRATAAAALIAAGLTYAIVQRDLSGNRVADNHSNSALYKTHTIHSAAQSAKLAQEIAREVAKNHIRMKPLEVNSNRMDDLRAYFTELDFAVAPSALLPKSNIMLGGRYCSIKGVTAAQLRYQTPSGQTVTLYEVAYDQSTFGKLPALQAGENPLKLFSKGLEVNLWQESGLLMAEVKELN